MRVWQRGHEEELELFVVLDLFVALLDDLGLAFAAHLRGQDRVVLG